MKDRFPGFKKCMAMMRKRDSMTQEEGFRWLLPHAAEHLPELIEEFGKEKDHGLRCWLLELIGSARSPEACGFLAGQLAGSDQQLRYWAIWGLKNLNSKEARTLLWQAHSLNFASPEETEAFRANLDAVLNKQDW